jgi:hypothetical protein
MQQRVGNVLKVLDPPSLFRIIKEFEVEGCKRGGNK